MGKRKSSNYAEKLLYIQKYTVWSGRILGPLFFEQANKIIDIGIYSGLK